MDKNNSKHEAMQQVQEIYSIIEGNLKAIISGPLMITTGIAITTIPAIELFFSQMLDPYLQTLTGYHAHPIIFILRTIFYWTLFSFIGRYFNKPVIKKNAFIEKVFSVGEVFPIIPIATSAMLALTGHTDLISPIILILVGSLLALYGQFSSVIVTIGAWANIVAGIVAIGLTTYQIPHLWVYLVCYQGCSIIIMGIILWYMQNRHHDNQ
jgi:hypothetical protein